MHAPRNPALTQSSSRRSSARARSTRTRRESRARRSVTLSDGPPAACDPTLRAKLRESAERLGLRVTDLASGAGHDTAFMTRICPSAMVFVPCRDGKSHAPEEWADRDAIAAGAAVMLETVKSLDRSSPVAARANEGPH